MNTNVKPTVPEVIDCFRAYLSKNPAWGSLHVVLDDGNVDDASVDFCIRYAKEHGDDEGTELGRILRQMSRTQRLKLGRL